MKCYGFIGRKPCPNEAVWIETETYDDPLVKGVYDCRLCEDCYQTLKRYGGDWKKIK